MTQLTLVIGNKNYSSWSLRPWLAMKQAGLDFREVRVDLYTPTAPQEIQQYSAAGKVPVLLNDSLTIWDSLAICEHLAEHFPTTHWWPEDKVARAIARAISAEMHSGFQNLRQNMPMNCRARLPAKGMAPGVQADIERITTIWNDCRQRFSSGGEMLFGEFTIADAMFAPIASRFTTYDVQLDPVSRGYVDSIWALTAMQEWAAAAQVETAVIASFEL